MHAHKQHTAAASRWRLLCPSPRTMACHAKQLGHHTPPRAAACLSEARMKRCMGRPTSRHGIQAFIQDCMLRGPSAADSPTVHAATAPQCPMAWALLPAFPLWRHAGWSSVGTYAILISAQCGEANASFDTLASAVLSCKAMHCRSASTASRENERSRTRRSCPRSRRRGRRTWG